MRPDEFLDGFERRIIRVDVAHQEDSFHRRRRLQPRGPRKSGNNIAQLSGKRQDFPICFLVVSLPGFPPGFFQEFRKAGRFLDDLLLGLPG